jgi:hypothetical protein
MMAMLLMIGPRRRANGSLAIPERCGYRPRCGVEQDSWVVMLRMQEDEGEVAEEQLGVAMSWEKIATC